MKHLLLAISTMFMLALLVFSFSLSQNQISSVVFAQASGQLLITGSVQNVTTLTIAQLRALPATSVNAPLFCVDYPSTPVTTGTWRGVQLWALLQIAGVVPSALKIAFHAQDGFSTDLTISAAKASNFIVAYEKDGAPLGEVLRLVTPGLWGYKWIAQLTVIELVETNFLGTYERQGFADDGGTAPTNITPAPPPSKSSPSPSPLNTPSLPPSTISEPSLSPSPSFSPSLPPIVSPSISPSASPLATTSLLPSASSTQTTPPSSNSESRSTNLILAVVAVATTILVAASAAILFRKHKSKQKPSA